VLAACSRTVPIAKSAGRGTSVMQEPRPIAERRPRPGRPQRSVSDRRPSASLPRAPAEKPRRSRTRVGTVLVHRPLRGAVLSTSVRTRSFLGLIPPIPSPGSRPRRHFRYSVPHPPRLGPHDNGTRSLSSRPQHQSAYPTSHPRSADPRWRQPPPRARPAYERIENRPRT